MPWNTDIPSTSSTHLSWSECLYSQWLQSYFIRLNTVFRGRNQSSSLDSIWPVDFPSRRDITACLAIERTRQHGPCGCFTHCSELLHSRTQPSNGAATTDDTISRPTKRKTLTRSRKDSCGRTWDGLWSIKEKKSLSMLKICKPIKSSHGKTGIFSSSDSSLELFFLEWLDSSLSEEYTVSSAA